MFKSVFAAVAAAPFLASAALAGPYVNVETNAGWTGDDYTGATTDAHVATKAPLVILVHPTMFRVALLSFLLMVKNSPPVSLVKPVLASP